MNTIEIFLKALEEAFTSKRGVYVPVKKSIECKFPAYKHIILEVWCIDGEHKVCISKVDIVERVTDADEHKNLEDKIAKETIKNILKYYGI